MTPAAVDETDIAGLKEAGLDERGILDLSLVVAYFNFVNRLADGLGIPIEEGFSGSGKERK